MRPQAVVTSVAKEVARYNNLATNAQALNVNIAQHVLTRSKAEVLHLVELLIAKVMREKCPALPQIYSVVQVPLPVSLRHSSASQQGVFKANKNRM